jgi:nitrate/TMAO reductase-like tetraheme cytochrome c subunit
MKRTTMRALLFSGWAFIGMLGAACASGPSGSEAEPAAAPTPAPAQPAAQAVHPRVSFNRSCVACHENRTPEVVESWRSTAHGETNIGCYVCHGDAQETFVVRPEPELCMSCHDGELESYEVVEGHHFSFNDR